MTRVGRLPWLLLSILLAIGALAVLGILSMMSHEGDLPNWGIIIAVLFGIFFVTWTWALLRYLRWKGGNVITTRAQPVDYAALKGTVYGLIPGVEYQVVQAFTDFYQNQFQPGERLTFKERHFLPYHGGHTIIFEQRTIYLQEDANDSILHEFSKYVAQIE